MALPQGTKMPKGYERQKRRDECKSLLQTALSLQAQLTREETKRTLYEPCMDADGRQDLRNRLYEAKQAAIAIIETLGMEEL